MFQFPKHYTGVAQRQSVYNTVCYLIDFIVCFVNGYRLISGRSQDRNLSPVLSSLVVFQKRPHCVINAQHLSYPLSSVAERQAHNLEVVGSKPSGGILSYPFGCFKEATKSNTTPIAQLEEHHRRG